jgi:putative ABC transport system permease protein
MKLSKAVLVALTSLGANKLRSALTILGIVIGVGAVIALTSIGRGVEASITAQIESVGTNLVFVMPGRLQEGGAFTAVGSAPSLTLADAEAIAQAPSVVGVSPILEERAQIVYLSQNTNSSLLGVTPSYLEVNNFELADGEFISDANLTARSTVAVLGSSVADTLFGGEAGAVGQTIRINGQPYRVIGVLTSKGGTGFGSQDDRVLLPLTTVQTRLTGPRFIGGSSSISVINVQVASADLVAQATGDISAILRERHNVAEGEEDFIIQSQEDILEASTQISDTLTLFLGGIAAISLVVGGIGIMNIMLVSVTERTREIGIRKAVGARRQDILVQFLLESATLSLVGGLIGIVVGWLTSRLIGGIQLGASGVNPVVGLDTVLMATVFSMAIGLFFGVYPATRAASLNPIEALRYE